MLSKIIQSPVLVRALPFIVFGTLTAFQGKLGITSPFWVYAGKSFVGAALLWWVWPHIAELRWKFSVEAVVMGVAVFVMWVGLDPFYPKWMKPDTVWNPHQHVGNGLAWFYIVVRIVGSTLVVPPLEELFYRSFLYRYIERPDFLSVPLTYFRWLPFLVTSVVFGLAHFEWLAGILCGFAYQGLVIRKGRLGDAMTAHAITNFLLGIWVVWKGAWNFW